MVDAYACERLLVAAKASLSRELTLTNERLAKLEKRMAVANEEAAASIAMAESNGMLPTQDYIDTLRAQLEKLLSVLGVLAQRLDHACEAGRQRRSRYRHTAATATGRGHYDGAEALLERLRIGDLATSAAATDGMSSPPSLLAGLYMPLRQLQASLPLVFDRLSLVWEEPMSALIMSVADSDAGNVTGWLPPASSSWPRPSPTTTTAAGAGAVPPGGPPPTLRRLLPEAVAEAIEEQWRRETLHAVAALAALPFFATKPAAMSVAELAVGPSGGGQLSAIVADDEDAETGNDAAIAASMHPSKILLLCSRPQWRDDLAAALCRRLVTTLTNGGTISGTVSPILAVMDAAMLPSAGFLGSLMGGCTSEAFLKFHLAPALLTAAHHQILPGLGSAELAYASVYQPLKEELAGHSDAANTILLRFLFTIEHRANHDAGRGGGLSSSRLDSAAESHSHMWHHGSSMAPNSATPATASSSTAGDHHETAVDIVARMLRSSRSLEDVTIELADFEHHGHIVHQLKRVVFATKTVSSSLPSPPAGEEGANVLIVLVLFYVSKGVIHACRVEKTIHSTTAAATDKSRGARDDHHDGQRTTHAPHHPPHRVAILSPKFRTVASPLSLLEMLQVSHGASS